MSILLVTVETLSERDLEYLKQAAEEFGVPLEIRETYSGDEQVILVEHRDLSQDEVIALPQLQTVYLLEWGRARLPFNRLQAKGVSIRVVPNLGGLGVAEHVFALMLAIKKKVIESHQAVIQNVWRPGVTEPLHTDQRAHVFNWSGIDNLGWLYGQTIGIIGFGRIGREVAKRAQAFEMQVIYFNRHRLSRYQEQLLDVRYAELDELLSISDVVTLNLPFNAESDGLLGEQQFARMKPTAILINAARGRVVDEEALVSALRTRTIAAAGLDVLEYEPPQPDHPLLQLDNVVLSPHIAGVYDPLARHEQFRTVVRWMKDDHLV